MRVEFCSHCQGRTPVFADSPRYSVVPAFDDVHGFPIIEVLKNGGPVHRYDSHFRFGRRKAELIVACVPLLRDFGWATDEERLRFEPVTVLDETRRKEVHVSVEMQPDFEYSTGETVNRPWLRLAAANFEKVRIGLGVTKCRALWTVRDELKAWVDRQHRSMLPPRLIA